MERAAWIILFIAVLIALQSREPKPRALPPLEATECVRFGLGKLTEREQTALGSRVGIPILCAQEERPPRIEPPIFPDRPRQETSGEVMFNTKSGKYHCPSCRHVPGCRNCVPISRAEAQARGTPCGNCGGC